MFFKNASTFEYILLSINIFFFSLCLLYLNYNEDNKIKLLKTRIENLENKNIPCDYYNINKKFDELKSLVLKHHNEYHETFKKEEKRVNEKFDFINMDIKKIKKTLNDRNFI